MIRYTEPAENDVKDIFAYTLENWGEAQAKTFVGKLAAAIRRISETPERNPLRRITGRLFRVLRCERHLIYYRDDDSGVLIVRVLHAGRNIESEIGEDES